jgi:hypothetical protein
MENRSSSRKPEETGLVESQFDRHGHFTFAERREKRPQYKVES